MSVASNAVKERSENHCCFWISKNVLHKIMTIFLSNNLNICFWCSKELPHWDSSFEYQQHMFWSRNKENDFLDSSLLSESLISRTIVISVSCLIKAVLIITWIQPELFCEIPGQQEEYSNTRDQCLTGAP